MCAASNHASASPPGQRLGGCLVLTGAEAPAPEALLKALVSRGMQVKVVVDEPGVMSALADRACEHKRVLVVVEPGRWKRLAELICAVSQYHSDVLCWQYTAQGEAQPKLTTLDQRVSGPGSAGEAGARDSGPIGRIVGQRRRPVDKLLTRVPGQPLSTREVVTQQELTMLLGPVPGEAS